MTKSRINYNYKEHADIPPFMQSYLLDVSGAPTIESIHVDDLNTFLNGLDWFDYLEDEGLKYYDED